MVKSRDGNHALYPMFAWLFHRLVLDLTEGLVSSRGIIIFAPQFLERWPRKATAYKSFSNAQNIKILACLERLDISRQRIGRILPIVLKLRSLTRCCASTPSTRRLNKLSHGKEDSSIAADRRREAAYESDQNGSQPKIGCVHIQRRGRSQRRHQSVVR